jgi:hypothetical protein
LVSQKHEDHGADQRDHRFKQTCIRTVYENEQAQLDFNAIDPKPNFFGDNDTLPWSDPRVEAWHDWTTEHWGTKWNAHYFRVTVDAPGCYEFHFDTAWSPPVPVWEKMAKMFPALEFSLSGYEAMNDFAFEGTIQGGKLELRRTLDFSEPTDPKTGETISG